MAHQESPSFPYIPGLLAFREAPALLHAFEKVHHNPDVIFVDGHGLSHPRSAGIACHIGYCLNKPTIGCAKSLLIGRHRVPGPSRGSYTSLYDANNRVIGAVVRARDRVKPVFVSVGHRIGLAQAVQLTLACGEGYRIPEPTRQADRLPNRQNAKPSESDENRPRIHIAFGWKAFPAMRFSSLLPLLLFFLLMAMLPLAFGHLFTSALVKLHMEPASALLIVIGIFLGSPINIPVKRISRTESVPADPLAVFGFSGWWPMFQRVRRETVIAVNVGGCLIPVALVVYETAHLVMAGWWPVFGLLLAIFINTAVCYRLAKPVEGIGITMPGLFPPLLAALSALLLVPDHAPPIAFVAGVLGPLIGADLLHLRDIEKITTGIASIGGAGTFDGIVLSGIVAAYLA